MSLNSLNADDIMGLFITGKEDVVPPLQVAVTDLRQAVNFLSEGRAVT
jgi:hypothetical protein